MYQQPPGRYQSYEYDEETIPHASHEYYEAPEYPGKLNELKCIKCCILIFHESKQKLIFYLNSKLFLIQWEFKTIYSKFKKIPFTEAKVY